MDASIFQYNDDQYYIDQIIETIKFSFHKLKSDKIKQPYNKDAIHQLYKDEKGEKAKNQLEDYLRNDLVKNYINEYKSQFNIENLLFLLGIEEINNDTLLATGILDIKVVIPTPYLLTDDPYLIIECKRISNKESKKKYYIEEGIYRFISKQYYINKNPQSSVGFLLAFMENELKTPYKIDNLIEELNSIIQQKKYNTKSQLILDDQFSNNANGFFLVNSSFLTNDSDHIDLKHILLDYRDILN